MNIKSFIACICLAAISSLAMAENAESVYKKGVIAYEAYEQKNNDQAATLFEQACDAGSGEACYKRAEMYAIKYAIKSDKESIRQTLAFLAKGCINNHASACLYKGAANIDSEALETTGMKPKLSLATKVIGMACELGEREHDSCKLHTVLKSINEMCGGEFADRDGCRPKEVAEMLVM